MGDRLSLGLPKEDLMTEGVTQDLHRHSMLKVDLVFNSTNTLWQSARRSFKCPNIVKTL